MQRLIITLISLFIIPVGSLLAAPVKVQLDTNMGAIVLELDADKAPKTVENFLKYVDDDYYTNTIFHRVIVDFMIQGGGYTPQLQKKTTRPPVINEASNGLKNIRGTIAMARTYDPHSATSQFFINVADNSKNLDYKSQAPGKQGYCVFCKVIKGMDVVDKIRQLPTVGAGPFRKDVPRQSVVITAAKRLAPVAK